MENSVREFVILGQQKNKIMFSKETYLNRRKNLTMNFTDGILLFLGNIENPRNFALNQYPFRQDSNFLYYFGIQEPRIAAIIDINEDKTIVFGDELTVDDIVWMGQLETLHHKAERSGVTETRPYQQLFDYVKKAKSGQRKVHYLPPYQSANKILLSELLDCPISAFQPSESFITSIISQRSHKEAQELEEIEKAVNVSNQMHLAVMKMARPGVKEYELVAEMLKIAQSNNQEFSYPSIMTINGQTLHNHDHSNTLKSGQLLLNDSGSESTMGYAGDLTRSFPVDVKFTTKQREIYDIVLDTHMMVANTIKPGIRYKDVHLMAARIIATGLTNLGLMKGNPEEAVAAGAHALFFPHGLGHMMGLDVHDMEDLGEINVGFTKDDPKDLETFGLNALRLGRKLEPGFVLTDEPGIYFIPELVEMWEKEQKFTQFINYAKVHEYLDFGGIRIEDNFVITETGGRKLGEYLIKTADEIEAYRS